MRSSVKVGCLKWTPDLRQKFKMSSNPGSTLGVGIWGDGMYPYPYGFAIRFEDDRRGSNPEELLGTARAVRFTMAFSIACDKAGLVTCDVDTKASARLSWHGEGFVIDRITLTMHDAAPGIDEAKFHQIAATAKRDCLLSKPLASLPEIALVATLRQGAGV